MALSVAVVVAAVVVVVVVVATVSLGTRLCRTLPAFDVPEADDVGGSFEACSRQ